MGVSSAAINEQARRLLRLPFAPDKDEDEAGWRKEFSRIIKSRCDNDEHVIAVVTRLMETSHRCPEPAAVVDACIEVETPAPDKAPGGCELCQGLGFQQYEKRDKFGSSVSVADYCICGLGQWLKVKHRQYREEQAQGVKRTVKKIVEAAPSRFIKYAPYIPDCERCEDWGHFPGADGKRTFCDCAQGVKTRNKYPDLMEKLNAKYPGCNFPRRGK
jgi:hypothetical protein